MNDLLIIYAGLFGFVGLVFAFTFLVTFIVRKVSRLWK
jgi:hypothetical protein